MHRDEPRGRADEAGFMHAEDFVALQTWIAELDVPGVLVLGQSLVAEPARWWGLLDRGLVDHRDQYRQLCTALAGASHDVLVLTRDIHYARYTAVTLDGPPRSSGAPPMLHELTVSPLTLLPEAGKRFRERRPAPFPHGGSARLGRSSTKDPLEGTYDADKGFHWIRWWCADVCRDHFALLEFTVGDRGEVHVDVDDRLVRPEDSDRDRPVPAFPPIVLV